MNWGYGIILAFVGFGVFILTLVVKIYGKSIDLVSEDYYAKEIRYEEQIEKINNAASVDNKLIEIANKSEEIVIQFNHTNGSPSGFINFFRPSDKTKDLKIEIAIDSSGQQKFLKKLFTTGKYKIQIDFELNSKKYFVEKEIMID